MTGDGDQINEHFEDQYLSIYQVQLARLFSMVEGLVE